MRPVYLLAAVAFLFSVIVSAQGCVIERPKHKGTGDHSAVAEYHEGQAQKLKVKAEDWEHLADYYEKFPDTYMGQMTVSEHAASLREAAQDLRKAAEKDEELADKHRAMIRQGVGP